MQIVLLALLTIYLIGFYFFSYAKEENIGKYLFYNSKGKYGACNHCHRNGTSAGRWNFETESVDKEEGRKIPSLKGINKRYSHENIEKRVRYMKKLFTFELSEEDIKELAKYISTL